MRLFHEVERAENDDQMQEDVEREKEYMHSIVERNNRMTELLEQLKIRCKPCDEFDKTPPTKSKKQSRKHRHNKFAVLPTNFEVKTVVDTSEEKKDDHCDEVDNLKQ